MSHLNFVTILCAFIFSSSWFISAQSTNSATTDFSCNSNLPRTCHTYLTYRARAPKYTYVKNISDLLGVNPNAIMEASKLRSLDEQLALNQLLLIPITCTCNGTYYFFIANYVIEKSDSFYSISTSHFQNLTYWNFISNYNPTLNPINLTIGSEAVFPLLCKCPSKPQSMEGVESIVTYVWQSDDEISTVGSMFDVPTAEIVLENNDRNFTAAIGLPVLIPVSHEPVINQLSKFALKRNNNNRTLVSVLCTIGVVFLILLASLLAYRRFLEKKKRDLVRKSSQLETSDLILEKKMSKNEKIVTKISHDKLLAGVSGYLGQPVIYERIAIMEATKNLDEAYKIGGLVYMAMIDDQIFAVKKVTEKTEELKILQKVNHGNIINLMGISSDFEDNCLLVFEYAEKGSLDNWLHQTPLFLTWNQRLNIALDVANGLQYLHEHTQPSIVHGDIRTSNILLGSNFKAKLSNFSVAKSVTNEIVLKIDVFSFGFVLLELLSGEKAIENGEKIRAIFEDQENREERLRNWMDPNLRNIYPISGAISLASLAGACISEKYTERPKMAEIVFHLSVLTQSSPGIYERFPVLGVENEGSIIRVSKPAVAR